MYYQQQQNEKKMTNSNIFKNAHARAKNDNGWEKYKVKFSRALRYWHARAKAAKLTGRKVLVIATGAVAYIKDAGIGYKATLMDANGDYFWNCGTRNGDFRMEDLKLI